MPNLVEIDEEEVLRLRKLQQITAQIWSHPEARKLVQRAQKVVDPNAVTPDLDRDKPIDDRFEALAKELAEVKKTSAEKEAKADQDAKLAKLGNDFESGRRRLLSQGVTEEGIKGCEELMEQKGILDHEVGWAYFEKLHPPQSPVAPRGSGAWNFLDAPDDSAHGEDIKKLIETRGESELLTDKMTRQALAEVRGQPRR